MKIQDILVWLDEKNEKYCFTGNPLEIVEGFSSLDHYRDNTFTWIKTEEKFNCLSTNSIIKLAVVQSGVDVQVENIIISNQSKKVFFSVLEHFWGEKNKEEQVGKGTVISSDVKLGQNVEIGDNCTLSGDINIGNGTVIGSNVVIVNHVTIGENCEIQSLSVIGEDGFGYYEDAFGNKTMIKHFGGVEIGDNVFIGSHVNIARGTIENTVIESGTKIAPTTHIGHNNYIGKNSTVICSNLFGSVEIGEQAYIVSSTVKNQCKIGKNTIVGMGSIVTKNIEDEKVVIGAPAKVIRNNK